jgi:hypothetical protein
VLDSGLTDPDTPPAPPRSCQRQMPGTDGGGPDFGRDLFSFVALIKFVKLG